MLRDGEETGLAHTKSLLWNRCTVYVISFNLYSPLFPHSSSICQTSSMFWGLIWVAGWGEVVPVNRTHCCSLASSGSWMLVKQNRQKPANQHTLGHQIESDMEKGGVREGGQREWLRGPEQGAGSTVISISTGGETEVEKKGQVLRAFRPFGRQGERQKGGQNLSPGLQGDAESIARAGLNLILLQSPFSFDASAVSTV